MGFDLMWKYFWGKLDWEGKDNFVTNLTAVECYGVDKRCDKNEAWYLLSGGTLKRRMVKMIYVYVNLL